MVYYLKDMGSFIIFNLKRLSYHNKVTADAVTKAVVNMRINPATAHKNEVNAWNELTLFEIHEIFTLVTHIIIVTSVKYKGSTNKLSKSNSRNTLKQNKQNNGQN